MKNRYPFLAHWMKMGLKTFPTFPIGYFEQVLKKYIEKQMPLAHKAISTGYNRSCGVFSAPVIADETEDLIKEDAIKERLLKVLLDDFQGFIDDSILKAKDEHFERVCLAKERTKTALEGESSKIWSSSLSFKRQEAPGACSFMFSRARWSPWSGFFLAGKSSRFRISIIQPNSSL